MSDETRPHGRAKGGVARAANLSQDERSAIARQGALAKQAKRVEQKMPKADYRGVLKIGDVEIPCCILNDGRRIVSESGISATLGATGGKSYKLRDATDENGTGPMPLFLASKALQPFIYAAFEGMDLSVVDYEDGSKMARGYEATILPKVCEVWLRAKEENALQPSQLAKAKKAEVLMRGLAHVGIVALVDEATGYQEVRPSDALQQYLEMIVRKELAAWAKKFPDEFYFNIYKLRGWVWPGMGKNRYSAVAGYTTDLVYERIAPGLLDELRLKSPVDESGKRKIKLHQWLTDDIGNPMLAQHIHSILMFQRLAIANGYGWARFVKMVDQVMPKKGATLELDLTEPIQ